jgi:raffinose synthase
LAACAYNAVFLSPLALPDFDMFQSAHPAARIHAAMR